MSSASASLPDLLLVDDDPLIRDALSFALAEEYSVHLAETRPQAIRLLHELPAPPQLALVDLGLPPLPHRPDEGFQLITELLVHAPQLRVIALSGQDQEDNARHARTLGAIEFIAKPCAPEAIKAELRRALAIPADRPATGDTGTAAGLVGQSPEIQAVRSQIELYAPAPYPVLIEGESGSGKELVATALHQQGPRRNAPFLAVNCAAITGNLLESALFGHAKGAFTGAVAAHSGFFEEAGEGTLFLDEIGELPPELQSKLLRVLENGEYQRVGETQTRKSRARIVAATNRDLRQATRNASFRTDLYHRLSVFTIRIPPLRELGQDKLLLLEHFRQHLAAQMGSPGFELDDEARQRWLAYPFPGNTRELRNIVIRLLTKHPGRVLGVRELEAEFDLATAEPDPGMSPVLDEDRRAMLDGRFNLDERLMDYTSRHIDTALGLARGNISEAAKLLGIARTTLYSRMEALQKHKAQKNQ